MKKKNRDFKKLALLGLAGGTTITTQAAAIDMMGHASSHQLSFNGCGGPHGCHGNNQGSGTGAGTGAGNGGSFYQAYRSTPSQGGYYQTDDAYPYYYTGDNQTQMNSCNGSSSCNGTQQPPMPAPQGYYYAPQPQPVQSTGGCGAQTGYTAQRQWQPAQSFSGCGAQTAFNAPREVQPTQPASSCGAFNSSNQVKQPVQQQGTPANGTNAGQQPKPQPQPSAAGDTDGWVPADTIRTPAASCSSVSTPRYETSQPTAYNNRAASTQGSAMDSATDSRSNGNQKPAATTMEESDLVKVLSPQGKATYQSLDAAGKALALKLANQQCKGQNECKGMNACKSEKNSCAGRGGCAGTAAGPFKDKNLAVKVAAMKMAEKRANAATTK